MREVHKKGKYFIIYEIISIAVDVISITVTVLGMIIEIKSMHRDSDKNSKRSNRTDQG